VAGSGVEVLDVGLIRFNEKREEIWIFGETVLSLPQLLRTDDTEKYIAPAKPLCNAQIGGPFF
jgi:hypothetical protein